MRTGYSALVAFFSFSLCLSQNATFGFLRNDASARAAALNGSFVAMTDDPVGIFYNPAILSTITHRQGSVSFLKHLLDVNGGSLSFSQEWESVGQLGLGIQFVDYGSFTRRDVSMNRLGEFIARDIALLVGIGRSIDEYLSLGVSLKYISSTIAEYSSNAVAIDLGVLYQLPDQKMTVGASALNLGTQMRTYAGVHETLPTDFKIGITKQLEHLPVLLSLNFHHLNEDVPQLLDRINAFSLGAEFLVSETVRLRGGYSNELRTELKLGTSAGLAGFSFGGGILVREYQIDYAFNSFGRIGALHRFSIGMSF
jgi:hypothetical protein